jgi:hypothetical protein
VQGKENQQLESGRLEIDDDSYAPGDPDATEGISTCANLVAALETAEALPSSPPLEGEAPL